MSTADQLSQIARAALNDIVQSADQNIRGEVAAFAEIIVPIAVRAAQERAAGSLTAAITLSDLVAVLEAHADSLAIAQGDEARRRLIDMVGAMVLTLARVALASAV